MSISHLFPEEGPTLNLNFAGSRTLDPRITFSRSQTTSNGSTYMDQNGLIRYAGPDEPRFDHRYVNGEVESLGLLVEESRTNLFTYSEDFVNAFPTKFNSSVSIDTNIISPSGTQNVYLFKENSATSQHALQVTTTYQSGFKYCFSVFSKAYNSGNRKLLVLFGAGAFPSQQNATFDLVTGTITNINFGNGTEAKMEKYPNGWYRCTIIGATTTSTAISTSNLYLIDENNTSSYTGDNTSGVYIWGAQVEQGSFPTSYIPTEGSTKTRNPDSVSMTGTNFSDWYNQSEGSILWRGTIHSAPISGSRIFEIYNSSTDTERMAISVENDGTMFMRVRKTNDTATQTYGLGTVSYGSEYKISLGVDGSSLCLAVNDEIKTTISDSFTLSLSDTLILTDLRDLGGARKFTTRHLNLSYYPTRLSNTVLQNLTK